MRYLSFRLINFLTRFIPAPVLKRLMRALYIQPELASRVGYHVYPEVFYNPFPNPAEVDEEKLKAKRDLPGIDLQVPESLKLLRTMSQFSSEIAEFHRNRTGNLKYWDTTYSMCDSSTLYAMLRQLKPKRYIEVGCGYSSRTSIAALERNQKEGHHCEITFIEPFASAHFKELKLPGEFIPKKIQEVPLARFQQLEAGDVLFIDTSHIIKVQNDVEYELIHVLPSLKPGVVVHIHDIFTPYDYPAEWLIGKGPNRGANNEQYALECLLSGGNRWEIILPVYLLWREHPDALRELYYSEQRPAAMWLRKAC